jgi:hypothetical protein
LLDPPTAPTASLSRWAAGPFTPRVDHAVTRHDLWFRYMPESGNWHGGTFTRWTAALSAAPRSVRDSLPSYGSCHPYRCFSGLALPPGSSHHWLAEEYDQMTQPLRSIPITGTSTLLWVSPPLCRRVDPAVARQAPHRTGRARLRHPVPHA